MTALLVGVVDTGVNAWHSHVRGEVSGCRIYAAPDGTLAEDDDFRDPVGHGTAVAGVLREALPGAAIFAVRVFDDSTRTWPSLVARGILRAAAAGCAYVNLSLALPRGPGTEAVASACAAAIDAGCVLVAALPAAAGRPIPASLPDVFGVVADDSLGDGEVRVRGRRRLAAPGRPRDLPGAAREANFAGPSFACARALAYLARRARHGMTSTYS